MAQRACQYTVAHSNCQEVILEKETTFPSVQNIGETILRGPAGMSRHNVAHSNYWEIDREGMHEEH